MVVREEVPRVGAVLGRGLGDAREARDEVAQRLRDEQLLLVDAREQAEDPVDLHGAQGALRPLEVARKELHRGVEELALELGPQAVDEVEDLPQVAAGEAALGGPAHVGRDDAVVGLLAEFTRGRLVEEARQRLGRDLPDRRLVAPDEGPRDEAVHVALPKARPGRLAAALPLAEDEAVVVDVAEADVHDPFLCEPAVELRADRRLAAGGEQPVEASQFPGREAGAEGHGDDAEAAQVQGEFLVDRVPAVERGLVDDERVPRHGERDRRPQLEQLLQQRVRPGERALDRGVARRVDADVAPGDVQLDDGLGEQARVEGKLRLFLRHRPLRRCESHVEPPARLRRLRRERANLGEGCAE